MLYKIELKTISNDTKNRMPSLKNIKKYIDEYSEGNNGVIVLHNSFYDYRYDTRIAYYDHIDTHGIVGHITSSLINLNKVYLIADINEDVTIEGEYVCIYRAIMSTSIESNNTLFDQFHLFAVDLIHIAEDESLSKDKLSSIEIYED